MASLKKYSIIGIFISILTIFAMSHNANATSTTINLNNFDVVISQQTPLIQCNILNAPSTNLVNSGSDYCQLQVGSNTVNVRSIETVNTFSVKKGDLLTFNLFIVSRTNSFETGPLFNNMVFNTIAGGWDFVGVSNVIQDNYGVDYLSTNAYINSQPPNYDLNFDLYTLSGFIRVYEITLRARADGNLHFGLNSGNTNILNFSSDDIGQITRFSVRYFTLYRFAGDEANKEVEEKTQEAVDESQSAGSSSSSSASQGGANLLTAITGFFNVITSAQPSNCRFNAPLNTYFGNERLNVDLCALDLPSGIGALTSIIAIGILIPFAIHMFNKFIALFRSFQS